MTVSHTCQEPIKFWAKCKINLLYKLNQSLLRVPGCPLLLATRLRTWASFPLPLILHLCLMCIHKAIPSPALCPARLAPIWPALPAALLWCYPSVHRTRFTNPHKTSPVCCSWLPGRLRCLVPVCGPRRAPTLALSIFLSLPRMTSGQCPLPFPALQYLYVI